MTIFNSFPAARHLARTALGLGLATAFSLGAAEPGLRYVVQPGDTLTSIGERLLAKPQQWQPIQAANGIADPDRLSPSQTLVIPARLLRRQPVEATVVHVQGSASIGSRAAVPGMLLSEGQSLTTGDDAFVTLKTPDGSVFRLQPRSTFQFGRLRAVAGMPAHEVRLELKSGRVETDVAPVRPAVGRFEVQAPRAIIGVRGTKLRVGAESEASSVELTEGEVQVAVRQAASTRLKAGYGLVAADGKPAVSALLPAPDLEAGLALQERIKISLPFAPVAGAVRYRTQVAADEGFTAIMAESLTERPEAKFVGLPDGSYRARVRAIDGRGLEGRDAELDFRLKARPEPPFTSQPLDGGKAVVDSLRFTWAAAAEAASYRFQLARDRAFRQRLVDVEGLTATEFMPAERFEPGEYFWRVASTRADGDRGPFGDPRGFTLRLPTQAEPPSIEGGGIAFAWSGSPGQTFEFQVARDERFADLLDSRRLDAPRLTLDRPSPGTYYMRVRATDPDGFVEPWGAAQRFEVPMPWWPFLLLLAPLL